MADWFRAGLDELQVTHGERRAPLYAHIRANRVALGRWAYWRRLFRRHGWRVPLFMRPWDRALSPDSEAPDGH